jgi:hypothetical protein
MPGWSRLVTVTLSFLMINVMKLSFGYISRPSRKCCAVRTLSSTLSSSPSSSSSSRWLAKRQAKQRYLPDDSADELVVDSSDKTDLVYETMNQEYPPALVLNVRIHHVFDTHSASNTILLPLFYRNKRRTTRH